MSEVNSTYDDEIDFFELFQTLWLGKWKIISTMFITALIGVFFSYDAPKYFEVSTPIKNGKQSVFLKYTPVNELMEVNGMLFDKEDNPDGYIIHSDSIFKDFIDEFNDYEEMADAISSSKHVQELIKDYDEIDKQRALIEYSKSFEIRITSESANEGVLYFVWHDDLEGVLIFNDAIQKTLKNIRDASKENVDNLATAIDIRNTQELETLRNEINLLQQKLVVREKKKIQYLIEQSAIAKELGIETNRLEGKGPSRGYDYLRGYEAIDKEIKMIQNRSEEERLLNTAGYIETKEKILSLEKDLSSTQLRKASEMIAADNPNDWVEFDLAIADKISSQNKMMQYVTLSLFLGGMIGSMYVLILNAIRKRKNNLVNKS